MSVQDITPDSVIAAVEAGRDDVYKLAEHFGVLTFSHTLNTTLTRLVESWPQRLVIDYAGAAGEPTRFVVPR